MVRVEQKSGSDLGTGVLEEINKAKNREFGDDPLTENELQDSIFFLLYADDKLAAFGRLFSIDGVKFEGKDYSLYGINGIVSLEKGKGYGRQVMNAMSNYLVSRDRSAIGFCRPEVRGFYEKCNYLLDVDTVPQFRFPVEFGKESLNDDDTVVYYEGFDGLMAKLRAQPEQEVYFPCHPW